MDLVRPATRGGEDLRAGAGKVGEAVMLRQPIAAVAHGLGCCRQLDGLRQRIRGGTAGSDRGLVDYAQD